MNQTIEAKPNRLRRPYDAPFKRAAVEHYRQNGRSLTASAQALGINHWTLRDWVQQARNTAAPNGNGHAAAELEAEIRRLKLELEQVIAQRDTLKKSLIILFAK